MSAFKLDFFVTGQMSEPPKRHSTRERRPNKFRQMMENDFVTANEGKTSDAKESVSNTQETKQLAMLLVKFITNSNRKLRDIQREDNSQLPNETIYSHPSDPPRHHPGRVLQPRNTDIPLQCQSQAVKHPRDGDRSTSEMTRGGNRKYTWKGEQGKKGGLGLPASIESDLSYHTMLGQHIRSNLPDSHNNLSPQMLMKLGLPSKELLQQSKVKESDKKKKQGGGESKMSRQSREQLKPFKRQSYHVAIAYHIFLKQIKTGPNPNPNDIDPTFNARKLRDQSQKQ